MLLLKGRMPTKAAPSGVKTCGSRPARSAKTPFKTMALLPTAASKFLELARMSCAKVLPRPANLTETHSKLKYLIHFNAIYYYNIYIYRYMLNICCMRIPYTILS